MTGFIVLTNHGRTDNYTEKKRPYAQWFHGKPSG